MIINYEDGSKLSCNKVVIAGNKIYADDLYEIFVEDVESIEESYD